VSESEFLIFEFRGKRQCLGQSNPRSAHIKRQWPKRPSATFHVLQAGADRIVQYQLERLSAAANFLAQQGFDIGV